MREKRPDLSEKAPTGPIMETRAVRRTMRKPSIKFGGFSF